MSSVSSVRTYAIVDGATLLFLVLVAMPLKYFASMPLAVRVVGSVHGLVFVLFVIALVRAVSEHRWPLRVWMPVLFAAVVPGGIFFLHRALKDVPGPSGRG
jgi:integral membrane protein